MTTTEIQQQDQLTQEQVFAILKRISFPLSDPTVLPEPTFETLRELQYRCVTSIPFETLSLRTTKSREVDITLQGVYDRVVNQKRGGWCFSLNLLGLALVQALGYSAEYVLGRICDPRSGDTPRFSGLTHRTTIVQLKDGSKYVFEIAYGATHFYPLELKDGAEINYFGNRRRMTKMQRPKDHQDFLGSPTLDLWCMYEYKVDKWVPCYNFTEQRYLDIDCDVGNSFVCFSPRSELISVFWVMQGALDGSHYILMDNELKIRTSTGTGEKIVFEKEQDRLDALEKYFGIVLTAEELEYHDKRIE
ncbi:N-terminal acetyltransferase [Entomortierella beljakovae]|nr:N-terminal acetyltransferase [Entomortierella beljakovae]